MKQPDEARLFDGVTCRCGTWVGLIDTFKCLYCKIWFCKQCAEEHFGEVGDWHDVLWSDKNMEIEDE